MDSRRDFLKKAAMLSGAAGLSTILPPSVQRAFAINPEKGTTFMDAEHIVILMQENRSFDHCFGSLQGVRGFNDPRTIKLPNKNSVFLQSNAKGETYVPFRLNIKDTNATWMGSLPHGWTDQTDARNGGRYDKWLEAKQSGHKDYKEMPLTLGYYDRQDLSFYYSLADAFTVCDQNFCSSLTGTTPNRLHLWTGKIREDAGSQARVRNEETDYGVEAAWKTFPERLEENGVSWKVYQNELNVGVGFEGEEDAWLSNFSDNPLEWFDQYKVRFHPAHIKYMPAKIRSLEKEIASSEEKAKTLQEGSKELSRVNSSIKRMKKELDDTRGHIKNYTAETYSKLSAHERAIHVKAFTTNSKDPNYHKLSTLKYNDGGMSREMNVPAGDVLHQFREDVHSGKLPTVSWLIAPENFSDHPGAPWYGAWYLSESIDILTKNPEVWKKTIFILCYDENDGYFDHVPPFVSPTPGDTSSGFASKSISLKDEYVSLEDDLKRKSAEYARGGPIGLGYRVPLVVASPWSRGGAVCSQVFDHTSILQLLEKFLTHKTGKRIEETNISGWRRTVCGDLTSVFKPYDGENIPLPKFLARDEFVEGIHKAQFKKIPSGFKALTKEEIETVNSKPAASLLPRQEKGTRAARALPYQLYADGHVTKDGAFEIKFKAGNEFFGANAAGSPFTVYSFEKEFTTKNYAVTAGDSLTDSWKSDGNYHLAVHGPNGFYREFRGTVRNPALATVDISCEYEKDKSGPTGNILLNITNNGTTPIEFQLKDNAYKQPSQTKKVAGGSKVSCKFDLSKSFGWYDVTVGVPGNDAVYGNRFAGRVETGRESVSDPAMA